MITSSKPGGREDTSVTINFSDSLRLIRDQVQWTPKGLRLLTKWYFEEGTEIEVAFDHRGQRHCCTGIVVGCRPLEQPRGHFEMFLYFVDTLCPKLQQAAHECRLTQPDGATDQTNFTANLADRPRPGVNRPRSQPLQDGANAPSIPRRIRIE